MRRHKTELIDKIIKEASMKLLFIDERVFAINTFNEASEHSHKHYIEGRDITSIYDSELLHNAHLANFIQIFMQKVNTLPILKLYYHKDEKFTLYI